MAIYQENNIRFTNVTLPGKAGHGRWTNISYKDKTTGNNAGRTTTEIAVPTLPFINVIDIDWNGAYLESLDTYINSTSDLLNQIEFIYNSINNIDLSDYVKSSDLTTELLQNKLTDVFANKNEIPTSIYQLAGIDAYATTVWVNNQLRNYSRSAYDVYVDNGGTLSQAEWLLSLKGSNGLDGRSAYDIAKQLNPSIGSESDWIQSLHGQNGYSAYELAYNNDPTIGTLEEWLLSLKGQDGHDGDTGKSAYEIAVEKGFDGTEEEWLISLKGETGKQGEKGETGPSINILGYFDTLEELKTATVDTINGVGDAYNVNGIIYTYNDLYTSIDDKWKSAGQFKGDQGKSAYDIYYEIEISLSRTPLSESDWIDSLHGEQGKSAYDIYCEVEESFNRIPLSKSDWLESLKSPAVPYQAGNGISINNNIISVNSGDFWNILSNE